MNKTEASAPTMRALKAMNYFELATLGHLIRNYKTAKAAETEYHFIFANAIYSLLDLQPDPKFRLAKVISDEFMIELNEAFKKVKR